LSYSLAQVIPTPYFVGGFLGYSTGCEYALIMGYKPPSEVRYLAKFFKVLLLRPNSNNAAYTGPEILDKAVVISEISHDEERAIPESLSQVTRRSRLSVISTRGASGSDAPVDKLKGALSRSGLAPAFIGSIGAGRSGNRQAIAIIDNLKPAYPQAAQATPSPPSSFDVVAVVSVFNEVDIIVQSLEKMLAQGINVYLIDNWSNDGTYEAVLEGLGSKLVGLERFPMAGPHENFDLHSLLTRKEEIANTLGADWFIHCAADEIRCAPWPGMSLRDAIYRVDQEGYNVIDHTVAEFYPINNDFQPGGDFEDYFQYFTFGTQPADFIRINAWKNTGQPIALAARSGHQVMFEGRRIYPYKFLLKQYPFRSQEQGARKLFGAGSQRYFPAARPRWWPAHHDSIPRTYNFLKDPSALAHFDPNCFYERYLAQRLTGIGTLLQQPAETVKIA
jgi:Glycosyl transferase family 2